MNADESIESNSTKTLDPKRQHWLTCKSCKYEQPGKIIEADEGYERSGVCKKCGGVAFGGVIELTPCLESVLTKIADQTVTPADFHRLIQESLPASLANRMRRRMRPTPPTLAHQDEDGRQQLDPNSSLTRRVEPKREGDNNPLQTAKGRAAHRRTVRKLRRYAEAATYLANYYGEPISEEAIAAATDQQAIISLAKSMVKRGEVTAEWCDGLVRALNG